MDTPKRAYSLLLFLVALWCAGILLAPALKSAGLELHAAVYSVYSPICHQLEHRSLHLAGEKLAVCARCSSIYFSFLLALFIYPFLQKLGSPAVPRRWLLSVAVTPMIVDVLLSISGIHTGTVATRVATGSLFGAVLPFYLVPPFLEAILQVHNRLTSRGDSSYARKAEQT